MRRIRRALVFLAPLALVVGGAPAASAAPSGDNFNPTAADGLVDSLGEDRTAGYFRDADGDLVVNVTDAEAAAAVTAAGGEATVVEYSATTLKEARADLDAGVSGTAWSIDPVSNQVLVQADETVRGSALTRLKNTVDDADGQARLERVDGTFRPLISGGDAIYGGGYRCSLGFNVELRGVNHFLTAGHCGDVAGTWYADSAHSTLLGGTRRSSFPGNDYALVRFDNPAVPVSGGVAGQDISSAANPVVGQSVTRRGSTTGTHTGVVQALNVTVHYSSGETVRQMIQTNVCAEPGDSGGPLYDGSVALGLTSGGSGNCTVGGTTFYQPVVEALQRTKTSVL